jgi:hypothetical protein
MMQNMMPIPKVNIQIDDHDTDLTTSESGQLQLDIMAELNPGTEKKGKGYLAQHLSVGSSALDLILSGFCFKIGDKVHCVDHLRPKIYGEI